MISHQETFDKVSIHLLKQNKMARDIFRCLYRYEDEGVILKCAAGCLIKDEDYTEDMEGEICHTSKGVTSKVQQLLTKYGYDTAFVRLLQNIHDRYKPENWREKLCDFAIIHDLMINFYPFDKKV